MRSAPLIYRYLPAVFTADVLLRFFLAGTGVLLMRIAALVAGNGRWGWALPLFIS